jgi:hypothetical protein
MPARFRDRPEPPGLRLLLMLAKVSAGMAEAALARGRFALIASVSSDAVARGGSA